MRVLVDTSIWSLALRRRNPGPHEKALIRELSELIREQRVLLIGSVRQEVLSGIRETRSFEEVRERLLAFDDFGIDTGDYEEAARMFNTCRSKGVQGSHTDFLICAISVRHSAPVFTTDRDFENYAPHIGLELHTPRAQSTP